MADLPHLCACEFEKHISEMFEAGELQAIARGHYVAQAPYIDYPYFVLDEVLIQTLKRRVCRALAAREWFRKTKPPWAPDLPLSAAEIAKMQEDPDPRLQLVGHFADSLRCNDWNYQQHPPFSIYARGVMAYEHAPLELRNDPALRREFPPRPLAGIDSSLYWRTPEKIEEYRQEISELPQRWRAKGIRVDEVERKFLAELTADLNAISR